MAVRWPLVKAWLVDSFAALPSMSGGMVFGGVPVTKAAPTRFVTVGFVEDDNAGTFEVQPDYDGSVNSEVGEVRSKIVVNTGGSGVTAEEAAFSIVDEINAAIYADQTLGGLLSPEATAFCSVDVLAISNARGTATELVHVLRYTTTT